MTGPVGLRGVAGSGGALGAGAGGALGGGPGRGRVGKSAGGAAANPSSDESEPVVLCPHLSQMSCDFESAPHRAQIMTI